jgi:hypothetical protein
LMVTSYCSGHSVTLSGKKTTSGAQQIYFVNNGLPASGSDSVTVPNNATYTATLHCGGQPDVSKSVDVSVYVPPNPPPEGNVYCFKATWASNGICSTFSYYQSSQSAAEDQCEGENPNATCSSIDCGQMATACN